MAKTPEDYLTDKENIYTWVKNNLRPGMHVKFSGSRSSGRNMFRVVDKINDTGAPAEQTIGHFTYIRSPRATKLQILSHNAREFKKLDGSIVINESDIYATNDAAKITQVRVGGKWRRIRDLITET